MNDDEFLYEDYYGEGKNYMIWFKNTSDIVNEQAIKIDSLEKTMDSLFVIFNGIIMSCE